MYLNIVKGMYHNPRNKNHTKRTAPIKPPIAKSNIIIAAETPRLPNSVGTSHKNILRIPIGNPKANTIVIYIVISGSYCTHALHNV